MKLTTLDDLSVSYDNYNAVYNDAYDVRKELDRRLHSLYAEIHHLELIAHFLDKQFTEDHHDD
jgi:hypothetical protein